MKFKHFAIMIVAGTLASCGGANDGGKSAQPFDMTLTQAEKDAGILTPDVMYKMGRAGSSSLSPDGTKVVFTVSYYSVPENRSETALYVLSAGETEPVRITDANGNDSDPQWSADGAHIYFISDRSGSSQLWTVAPDGTSLEKISNIEGGINGYGVAATGDKAFYTRTVRVTKHESADIFPDMPDSKALIYDDLMARHWNQWNRGDYSHIFVAEMKGGHMQEGVDIMEGESWDAPMAPYFDHSEIAWSNGGQMLAYTCKKLTGVEYALSTDSNIYLYDTATGQTVNLTEGMPGYDKYPVFSPDDRLIAFRSMRRPGNEADKDRLFVMNADGSDKKYLTEDFDFNAQNVAWENENTLLFIAPIQATHQLCRINLYEYLDIRFEGINSKGTSTGHTETVRKIEILTEGDHDINAFTIAGGRIAAEVTRISMATELFDIDPASGEMAQITGVNAHVYDNITMGRVEKRWVKTTDGKQMLTWVIYPPDFDPAKKYPTLLYCQGGPQSVVSQSWSYRWNFQLMAAQGYVVVAPNRRGLPSFGQEWLDQISGDYSGQNIRDYLSAIDEVSKEPWSDETRLGCVGASYGGYSAFYLAGVHQKRFKAFIAHCGIFNFESMYGSTEELFFPTNDYGGPYWDANNRTAQRSYENSPHRLVRNWDTPILIIAGLNDFRVPYTQSLEAFTAARVLGIPSRLAVFENEAHQVFKPQNAIVWNREFFDWLELYVKDPQ